MIVVSSATAPWRAPTSRSRSAFPRHVTFVWVSSGGYASYAIDQTGRVWAWGDNRSGQLGTGSVPLRATLPVDVGIHLTQVSSTAQNVAGFAEACLNGERDRTERMRTRSACSLLRRILRRISRCPLSILPLPVRPKSCQSGNDEEVDMQYVMLIFQGTTPLPNSDEWAALSDEEQKQIYADYAALNETPGVSPGLPMGLPENATTSGSREARH